MSDALSLPDFKNVNSSKRICTMPNTRLQHCTVEIQLKPDNCQSSIENNDFCEQVRTVLRDKRFIRSGELRQTNITKLDYVEKIFIDTFKAPFIDYYFARVDFYLYRLSTKPATQGLSIDEDGGISATLYRSWELPHQDFSTLWDSLLFDSNLKQDLLRYGIATLKFAKANVDNRIIAFNRMVLLYGPPGTGKTSLAKAMAQRLSIIMAQKQIETYLLEVNTSALFSKYFSESSKLVAELFEHAKTLLDGGKYVVMVFDEVETLAMTREKTDGEPVDSVRVVNTMLVQLDSLRTYSNLLVVSTSNSTDRVDPAFMDRADLRMYVPLPGFNARSKILTHCFEELMNRGLIKKACCASCIRTCTEDVAYSDNNCDNIICYVASKSRGLSGRRLRKLPFQAYVFFGHCHDDVESTSIDLEEYASYIIKTIREDTQKTEK